MADDADDIIIMVEENGDMQMVYSDELAALLGGDADLSTARASHVEPHPAGDGWLADMGPVGGPYLCADGERWLFDTSRLDWRTVPGFKTRAEALGAEVAWLRAKMAHARLQPKDGAWDNRCQ